MSKKFERAGIRLLLATSCLVLCSGAVASDRGAVTALASLTSQISSFVGFSSGAVLYCTRKGGCTELEGTRESPVTALDTPRGGNSIRVWVGYEDGNVLFCTLTGGCTNQDLDADPALGSFR